jgi:hypothetical protein
MLILGQLSVSENKLIKITIKMNCSMHMQYELAAWACSTDMRKCSPDMQH